MADTKKNITSEWASKIGVFSTVFKSGKFHVRSRVRAELRELKRLAKVSASVERWASADYRWRMRVSAAEYGKVYVTLQATRTTPNFANYIGMTRTQCAKLSAIYATLWRDLMKQIEKDVPRRGRKRTRP